MRPIHKKKRIYLARAIHSTGKNKCLTEVECPHHIFVHLNWRMEKKETSPIINVNTFNNPNCLKQKPAACQRLSA